MLELVVVVQEPWHTVPLVAPEVLELEVLVPDLVLALTLGALVVLPHCLNLALEHLDLNSHVQVHLVLKEVSPNCELLPHCDLLLEHVTCCSWANSIWLPLVLVSQLPLHVVHSHLLLPMKHGTSPTNLLALI